MAERDVPRDLVPAPLVGFWQFSPFCYAPICFSVGRLSEMLANHLAFKGHRKVWENTPAPSLIFVGSNERPSRFIVKDATINPPPAHTAALASCKPGPFYSSPSQKHTGFATRLSSLVITLSRWAPVIFNSTWHQALILIETFPEIPPNT
jgi:hypothetical protein